MQSAQHTSESSTVVTLAVPAALGQEGVSRLLTELDALRERDVRVLVLRGTSTQFCRGMDLGEIDEHVDAAAAPLWERATQDFASVIERVTSTAAVTIAAVEGPAMGGGVGLLAACDFAVASATATFALPELLLGLVPAVILPVLAERIGLQPAKRWAMTQATWKADVAQARGLVDQVIPAERFDVELERLIRGLLRAHPRGVVHLKRLASEIVGLGRSEAITRGQQTLAGLLRSVEVRRELVAFRDFGLLPGEGEP